VAGKRSRELKNGAEPLVKALKKDTIVQKTLREIMNDKIGYEIQEDLGE
jgi:DNA-directed RNA polymerase subunit K/omega